MHVWALFALLALPAQGVPADVSADDVPSISAIAYDSTGDIVRARGEVEATWRDIRMQADEVVYDRSSLRLTATGTVTFTRGEERLSGSLLEMQTDTLAGTFYDVNGFLDPGIRVQGARLDREEDGNWKVIDGILIFCDENGEPIWEVTVRHGEIDEQYVRAWHSILRFWGFPVFYLPYLRTALETQPRASGFLTPQTSTSTTKGRSISQPFFLVLGRSADATVYGEYFSKRGLGGGGEFRWVPSATSRIEVNNVFVKDRLGQGGQRTRIQARAGSGRVRGFADLDVSSSFEFRQVFEEDFNVISSPVEQSEAFLTWSAPAVTYNVAYQRQGTFFRNQQTNIVRKLPALDAQVLSRPLGRTGAYFSLSGGVAAIHRRDAALESPAMVGRLDLQPRLELPLIRGPAFSWSHSLGVRETLYTDRVTAGSGGDMLNRLVLDYGFRLSGPRFEKPFGTWSHVVEPEVAYRYVTGVDDFAETLRVDETDLVSNTHEVRYGITNRILTDREILSWSVMQKYYLDPTFGGALVNGVDNVFLPLLDLTGFGFADQARRFSPIVSRLRVAPSQGRVADVQLDYDTMRHEFRSGGLIGRYRSGLTSYNVAYFRTRETPIQIPSNQVRASISYGNTERVGLNGALSFSYNVDESILQATIGRLSYNTECYGLHFEFTQFDVGSRKESRFRFAFSLTDLGSIGTLRRPDQFF